MRTLSEKLAELGLSANPFVADTPLESLFPGAMRRASLDQLQLLVRESGDIVALIGPDGSGKSTLADFYTHRAERDQIVARARASLLTSPSQLLQEMFKAFVLDFPPQASIAQLKQVLSLYFQAVRNQSRTVVLVVDDAHELGDDAFNMLTKLALTENPGGTFHLILVGQASLIDMLDYTCPQKEGQNQFTSIRLPDFNLDETRNYIRYRLNAVGFNDADPARALPFSNRQIEKIHKLSAGVPAAINRLAGDMLFASGQGLVAWLAPALQIKLPRNYAYAAGALVFILLVSFLVGGGDEEPVETVQRQISLPVPQVRENVPLPVSQAAQQEVVDAVSSPFAEPEAEPEAGPAATPAVVANNAPAPSSSAVQSASASPVSNSTPAPAIARPSAPVVTSQPSTVAAPPSTPAAAQGVTSSTASSVEAAAPAASSLSAQRERIMSFADNQFTVQLLGASSRSNVEAFVQRNSESPLYWFETQNQGRPWYVVIHGNYPSSAAAQSAASGLSGELGRLQPWVRSIGAVQNDIQSNN